MINYLERANKPGVFRLFLTFLVILFHASRYFPFGDFAVNTFFILSGYWIHRMYDEFYRKQVNPYFNFIWSRVLLIFPLYYFCTILAIIVMTADARLIHSGAIDFFNFPYIISLITVVPINYLDEKILPPSWSLGIEMQFYLLAPLFILILRKMNGYLFFIAFFILSILASFSGVDLISLTVLPYLIFFSIGMLIWKYKPVISKKLMYWSLVIIVIVIATHYSIPALQRAIFIKDVMFGEVNYMYFFSNLLPFLFIPFIIDNLNQKSGKKDRSLGDLSYTIYLFHWIPFSIYNYYCSESPSAIRFSAFLVYLVLLFISSWVIYILFEKRVEVLRKMILGRV